ncbi:hypothetical protein JAAARDRAFT_39488 [Jaapia argillacea MUCL 33604]|uniref:Mitochondrial import inner membrane translocase subunit n=1 Tax=Jaapia argillacea MUCL 33604 TaxID=933084 RepID=A0A067PEB9_9AGAM|nr:hypothetical protein JAAARDRAFT_39488 [Jaapia argillacea MUCL 33604]
MSDFMKSPFGSSAAAPSPDMQARKEAMMRNLRNEMALHSAQELINKTNEKCFLKCVTKPSTSLSGSEETCLSRCLERYLEAFDLISRTYVSRIQRERLDSPSA